MSVWQLYKAAVPQMLLIRQTSNNQPEAAPSAACFQIKNLAVLRFFSFLFSFFFFSFFSFFFVSFLFFSPVLRRCGPTAGALLVHNCLPI